MKIINLAFLHKLKLHLYLNAAVASVFLHLLVGLVLTISFIPHIPTEKTPEQPLSKQASPKHIQANAIENPNKPKPLNELEKPVSAVSVDKTALNQQIKKLEAKKAAAQAAEAKRVADLERRAKIAKDKLAKDQDNIKKLEAEKRQAEASAKAAKERQIKESKRAKELKKQTEKQAEIQKEAVAQAKKAAVEAAKAKAEKEKLEKELKRQAEAAKQAKIAQQKAEAERKAKEKAAAERAELEKQMQQQMLAEQAVLNQQKQKFVMSEEIKYTALIKSAIQSNIKQDFVVPNTNCRVKMRLSKSGVVLSSNVISGNPQTCNEIKRAIDKTYQVPMSNDPDAISKLRDIIINFGEN